MLKPTPDQLREFFQSHVFKIERGAKENYESAIEEFYRKFYEDFEGVSVDKKVEQINYILDFPVGLNELYDNVKISNSITVEHIMALHEMGVPITGALQNLFGLPEFEILLMARLGKLKFRHFQLVTEELTKPDGFLGISPKRRMKRG